MKVVDHHVSLNSLSFLLLFIVLFVECNQLLSLSIGRVSSYKEWKHQKPTGGAMARQMFLLVSFIEGLLLQQQLLAQPISISQVPEV